MTDLARWQTLVDACLVEARRPQRIPNMLWKAAIPGCKGVPFPLRDGQGRQARHAGAALYWLAQSYGEAKAGRRFALAPALEALALDVGRLLRGEEPPDPPSASVLTFTPPSDSPPADAHARDVLERKDLFG